jgi:aromatic-L-amino-acid/L-tryptophan decarboxylase
MIDEGFDVPATRFAELGERVIALMQSTLDAERSVPVLRRIDGSTLRQKLDEPLPEAPQPIEAVLEAWTRWIQPYSRRNGHPRFFGYVCTSADPLGMLADALASALNNPVTAWRSAPAATEIERLVVRWLDELTGFGGGGSGLLVSGGSMANFHAIACALAQAEALSGLGEGSRHQLCAYLTREAHVSMRKALQVLGVPSRNVREIGIDDERRMRTDELRARLAGDAETGLTPAVVCASAGTANTGTIDPLAEIARICRNAGIWYHIDGSYGAPAVMTPDYRWMADAFAVADSLSLDPHKWLFAPPDAGCILLRDDESARRAFMLHSEYTAVSETGPIEGYAFFDHGLEMSRRFRGLKIWMILKSRGTSAIAGVIARDIALRRHLDGRIASDPRLEALGSELSISCFRYVGAAGTGARVTAAALEELNAAILDRLNREGDLYMSPTVLDGRYSLRVCIVNFRTGRADIDFLVDRVLQLGDEIATGRTAAAGRPG